jgi:ribosomal 30S subunit maturation factor RimM
MFAVVTIAGEIKVLPATNNNDNVVQNESKVICDKACIHLKELVDDLHKAGKYLFR